MLIGDEVRYQGYPDCWGTSEGRHVFDSDDIANYDPDFGVHCRMCGMELDPETCKFSFKVQTETFKEVRHRKSS